MMLGDLDLLENELKVARSNRKPTPDNIADACLGAAGDSEPRSDGEQGDGRKRDCDLRLRLPTACRVCIRSRS
jgi:hypothetical protein